MNVFDPYLEVIKKAVAKDPLQKQRLYSDSVDESQLDLSYIPSLRADLSRIEYPESTVQLRKGLGTPATGPFPNLGSHPDFEHLRGTNNSEDHWIISGFIDLKESTKLFNRFSKATVSLITESIVKASMSAVYQEHGYVHRIHGDGLMVYFGGKNQEKDEAVKNALTAFSKFTYFVKNDLKDFFKANDITDIYTRAGLDLGHNNQVKWIYSGIGNAGEVTTCSLHTSLAPKMQAKAINNGIVVGEHIVKQIRRDKFFNEKNKPIWDYGDGKYYLQYDFDWERYLVEEGIAIQDQYSKMLLSNGVLDKERNHEDLKSIASQSRPYFNF